MSAVVAKLAQATVHYWPSAQRGGVGVGHIAVRFSNGLYISHVPDLGTGEVVGHRESLPGSSRKNWVIKRHGSLRGRTLKLDEDKFGRTWEAITLPEKFLTFPMQQRGKAFLLANAEGEDPLHGPLPHYQIGDSKEGAGDRQQCATTTAMVVASGLTLDMQDHYKQIIAEYMPDALWDTLKGLVARLAGQ